MLRATCSADAHRCRPNSINTRDTRVFGRSRRTTYCDQKKKSFLVKNCHPRLTFDAPSQTRETAFNRDEGKHGQLEILESRDIRQVPNKRRVEVQSQNRDLLIRDVCTCLARRGEEFASEKQIAGRWHIITLQEASEYVDHELLTNRFHVTSTQVA